MHSAMASVNDAQYPLGALVEVLWDPVEHPEAGLATSQVHWGSSGSPWGVGVPEVATHDACDEATNDA